MRRISFLILSLLLWPGLLLAQTRPRPVIDSGIHPSDFQHTGRSGAQFLKLPTSARAAAIGGLTTGIGRGDALSTLGNASLLSDVEGLEIGLSRMNWLADISYNSAALVKNFGALGAFGLGLIYLDYGTMIRTENQEILDAGGNSTGMTRQAIDGLGTFSARDLSVGLSYGRRVTDRFQVGGTVKYVSQSIDDASSGQWAVDVGTMFYTGFRTLHISMVGRNYGPDAEFVTYDERLGIPAFQIKLPMLFVLGAGIDLMEERASSPHTWSLGAEFVHSNDGPERMHVGTEYSFMNLIKLRSGYRFNYDEEGLTLGGGLNMRLADLGLKADYAYISFGRLNSVHILTVGVSL